MIDVSGTRTSLRAHNGARAMPVVSASLAWALASLAAGTVGAVLILARAPRSSDFVAAMATSVLVVAFIGFLVAIRPSITHVTFIFMAEAFVYQVVQPWLMVTGLAMVEGGQFFVGNYRLLALGNKYFIFGLLAYGIGAAVAVTMPATKREPRRELVKLADATSVTIVLLGVAGLAWFIVFMRAGAPKEALLLIRPPNVIRNQSFMAGGWLYLLDISLSTNTALLVYVMSHSHKSLLSGPILGLFLCVLLFNGIRGSRLVFAMAPLSLLLLQQLMARRDPTLPKPTLGMFGMGIAACCLLGLALLYTQYRSLTQTNTTLSSIDWRQTLPEDAGYLTGTGITYYMVLARVPRHYDYWYGRGYLFPIVSVIPRFIFPSKYEVALGEHQFVEQFYGYDQWGIGRSANGYSLIAEAFLNLGVYGIGWVFMLLGWFNERLATRAHSPNVTNFFTVIYIYYLCYAIPELWKAGLSAGVWYLQTPLMTLYVVSLLISSSRPFASGLNIDPT
jgi:hypothetical protein